MPKQRRCRRCPQPGPTRAGNRGESRRRARSAHRRVIRPACDLVLELRRPRSRHGHGQVRPHRQQDCRDARQHRHARLLRAPGRSQPRRPRHDHARGPRRRHLQFGRDGRDHHHPAAAQAAWRAAHHHDRQSRLHARRSRDRSPRRRRSGGGLPAQPGADRQHDRDARHGRCAGGRAAREPRLHARGLRARAPRGHARPAPAAARGRRHEHRQGHSEGGTGRSRWQKAWWR